MLEMASATEDRETFYSPLPGNRAGSDDDEPEPITPPPPPQYPRALELVRSVLREETSEDGFGSLNYDPFTSDASQPQSCAQPWPSSLVDANSYLQGACHPAELCA